MSSNTIADAAVERRPMHRLFAAYLLVSATALLFPHRPPAWPLLVIAHLGGAALLLRVGPFDSLIHSAKHRFPRLSTLVADWYPLLIMPFLYGELAVLNVAVWNGRYFDPIILGWEEALFGGQPSRELARIWPNLALSEALHGAYLSYYFIIFGPPLILYATGRRSAQRLAVFTLMLTFLVHYVFFIYFPVQGPRYLFPPPSSELSRGPIYGLAHRVLETGSSRGAAFPSSHVGVSMAQAIVAFRLLPKLAPVLAILTVGLAVGAVYGGFHYATDAIAGLLLGCVLVVVAGPLRRTLRGAT